MTEIYELDKYPLSDRNGSYTGAAGSKEGITINGEYWIVKYPQRTRGMQRVDISYSTAPLSEYIGSHVYKILGYNVHETILGIRNDKLVVACKDFCKNEGSLRELRAIKNIYNKEIEETLDESMHSTGDAHSVNLYELMLHLDYNPVLSEIPEIKARFWDCAVIDILINNNDRNNGNWGVLKEGGSFIMAPIFDNGASFFTKIDTEKMRRMMSDPEFEKVVSSSIQTVYAIDGKIQSARKLLQFDNDNLKASIIRLVPIIREHMQEIESFINEIPEKHNGIPVMPEIQKEYYIRAMHGIFEWLIEPRYIELTESVSN